MKLKLLTIVGFALLGAAICYVGAWLYFGFCGHDGTATNKQALLKVYEAAESDLAAFSTSTFLQKLRFTAPIEWHRSVWRPSVSITSRVDMLAFRREMRDEPFVYLSRAGYSGQTNTYSFHIVHQVNDDHAVMTYGTFDMASGAFGMWSVPLGSKLDPPEWDKMTNGRVVHFTFEVPRE